MIGMVANARLPLNQINHPWSRPHGRVIPERLRPLQQRLFELVNLVRVQSRLTAGTADLLEPVEASGLPSGVPAAGRLGADPQAPRHLTLAAPTVEEFGGSKPPLLELVKIALQSFGVSHTPLDTVNPRLFTILYRYQ